MKLKLLTLDSVGSEKKIINDIVNVLTRAESEVGVSGMPIDFLRKSLRSADFKHLSNYLLENFGISNLIVFKDNKVAGLVTISIKKLHNLESKKVLFLEDIFILKKHRKKHFATTVIANLAKLYDYFGIADPIAKSTEFWNKTINKLYNDKIFNSKYEITNYPNGMSGYLCTAGANLIFLNSENKPLIVLKNSLSDDELSSPGNELNYDNITASFL